jgi:hypothetical protein
MKLYQIADLLRRRIDNKDVLFNENSVSHADGKLQEFFEGYITGEFKTDEEAANTLFGKGADYPYYFEIKSKMRDQLLKNLFHLNYNTGKFEYYSIRKLECELAVQQAKILLGNGLKENTIWLLKRTLRVAESFYFTSVIRDCCRMLKNQMVYSGNVKKYEEYQKRWMELEEVEQAEFEAEDLLNQMRVHGQKSVKGILNTMDLAEKAYKRVSELRYKYDTPFLIKTHIFLSNSYLMRTTQWEKTIELADEIEENSKKYPDKYAAIKVKAVHVSKLYALLMLNRIKEGLEYIESVLDTYRGDEVSYFIILEDYYLLCMRDFNYEKALEIVEIATSSKYFENVPAISQERWDIYREYAMFFAGEISQNDISLINYFPEYSKDKVGFNLQILILQVLILIRDGRVEQLHGHIENLRYYEIRQISKSDSRRAQYFLRLISLLSRFELDYEKCKNNESRYFNLLKKFPEKDQPYTEIEIVPYEILWKTIMALLKKRNSSTESTPINLPEMHLEAFHSELS